MTIKKIDIKTKVSDRYFCYLENISDMLIVCNKMLINGLQMVMLGYNARSSGEVAEWLKALPC